MKTINNYITEKLKISKNQKTEYTLFPNTIDELTKIIRDEINRNGNKCSLNHIDVSKIETMSYLFAFKDFDGDISNWNVSNVKNMNGMFRGSKFNGDISKWDVLNVTDMSYMFQYSEFNSDISEWDVSNVVTMEYMFRKSIFNQDISKWKINNKCIIRGMIFNCPIENKYKPKRPK